MKRFLLVLLIFCIFYLPANAKCECEQGLNVISVRGKATTDVKSDMANLSLAVETESRELKDAINENNIKSQKVYDSVKKLLGKDDKIQTANFNVRPIYTYDKNAKPARKLTGYTVTNQVKIRTKNIENLGVIMEIALENGANRMSSLSFGVSDREKLCAELLDDAAKNAKKEAEILADALGVKITGIKKVSTSLNNRGAVPYMARAMNEMALDAASPPVEAGETTISAEVHVDFIISSRN